MLRCSVASSTEGCGAGLRHRLILLTRSATHANGADDLAGPFERDAPGKDHDAPAVGGLNAVELFAGLRGHSQIPRGDIEGTRGEGLVDGNIDAAEPSSV